MFTSPFVLPLHESGDAAELITLHEFKGASGHRARATPMPIHVKALRQYADVVVHVPNPLDSDSGRSMLLAKGLLCPQPLIHIARESTVSVAR